MNHLMTKNGTTMKMKQLRRKNGRMIKLKEARRNSSRMKATTFLDSTTLRGPNASPQLSAMRTENYSSEQSDAMADVDIPALTPGHNDIFGRVMIEPDGSS
ncbi:hypothetical protein EJD97_012644 [Solanum chilense]|uniref:Uncharacterized protein n=1 Tax=Solanum chilense TaxID=4083 RepID=A0A6N2BI69_SOLCI|nr:hypothetical protein EJD97_012644 [Solanum chilense]